jgi:hypothetical protein
MMAVDAVALIRKVSSHTPRDRYRRGSSELQPSSEGDGKVRTYCKKDSTVSIQRRRKQERLERWWSHRRNFSWVVVVVF